MSICLTLRPGARVIVKKLDNLAATGSYDANTLDSYKKLKALSGSREAVYYLASLYLHIGDHATAADLLSQFDAASKKMMRYFHVLDYSRRSSLPVPVLSGVEQNCIGVLQKVLNPAQSSMESAVVNSGGFAIVGNAPGADFKQSHSGVRFYFNDYRSNKRIHQQASVHVVTPSWDKAITKNSSSICITGNDIFYRRSQVWQKFMGDSRYSSIYTVPVQIWSALYKELGTSPSAGLLMLGWLAMVAERNNGMLNGYVAGFSAGIPEINHSYDSVPASKRHNWEAEAVIRQRLLGSLHKACLNLVVEY